MSGNIYGGIGGNYVGVGNSTPKSGSYEAYLGAPSEYALNGTGSQYGPATTLQQTLAALPDEYYQISFYLQNTGCSVSNSRCGDYHNYFDVFWDDVQVMQSYDLRQSSGGYKLYTIDAATHNWSSVLLQFDATDDNGYMLLDDVSVVALGPVPEPASVLLVAPALAGLWYLRRRSAQSL